MDDQKIESIVRKVTALLDTNGCTEAEAESRVAKAQELLETYNLDMATLGTSDATRKDTKRKGGLYSWQRDLWKSVAEMNFCYYFSIKGLAKGRSSAISTNWMPMGRRNCLRKRRRLISRKSMRWWLSTLTASTRARLI